MTEMAGKRGGPRPGSGRPKGRRTSRSNILTRRKAAAIIESGLSPLDVMMTNLRWWYREVELLEKGIRAQIPDGESILRVEKTTVMESYFSARESLQEAAVDTAPYVHSRMSAAA